MTKSIKLTKDTHANLVQLQKTTGLPIQKLVQEAVQLLARHYFFKKTNNDAYAKIKKDPTAFKSLMDEYRDWDVTLLDGLENK